MKIHSHLCFCFFCRDNKRDIQYMMTWQNSIKSFSSQVIYSDVTDERMSSALVVLGYFASGVSE
jgi:hypothetical protein